jgi:hypothetical protein
MVYVRRYVSMYVHTYIYVPSSQGRTYEGGCMQASRAGMGVDVYHCHRDVRTRMKGCMYRDVRTKGVYASKQGRDVRRCVCKYVCKYVV